MMEQLKPDSSGWDALVTTIVSSFAPGELISHQYLKEALGLRRLLEGNFDSTDDLLAAFQQQQFIYMRLVDQLRHDLLTKERYYLENLKGLGYQLLEPNKQQQFAYDLAIKAVKEAFRQAIKIITHVRFEEVDAEERTKGNNLSTKLSLLKQMFDTVRKNS